MEIINRIILRNYWTNILPSNASSKEDVIAWEFYDEISENVLRITNWNT